MVSGVCQHDKPRTPMFRGFFRRITNFCERLIFYFKYVTIIYIPIKMRLLKMRRHTLSFYDRPIIAGLG